MAQSQSLVPDVKEKQTSEAIKEPKRGIYGTRLFMVEKMEM